MKNVIESRNLAVYLGGNDDWTTTVWNRKIMHKRCDCCSFYLENRFEKIVIKGLVREREEFQLTELPLWSCTYMSKSSNFCALISTFLQCLLYYNLIIGASSMSICMFARVQRFSYGFRHLWREILSLMHWNHVAKALNQAISFTNSNYWIRPVIKYFFFSFQKVQFPLKLMKW